MRGGLPIAGCAGRAQGLRRTALLCPEVPCTEPQRAPLSPVWGRVHGAYALQDPWERHRGFGQEWNIALGPEAEAA